MLGDCIYFLSVIKETPATSLYQSKKKKKLTSLLFTDTLQWNCGCRVKMFMWSIITPIPRDLVGHGNVTTCEPHLTSHCIPILALKGSTISNLKLKYAI